MIKNGINPILNQYDYSEFCVKIGIDEGENVVVLYGQDKSSSIDILGYCISITSKITTITEADQITVGKDVYFALDNALRNKFSEITSQVEDWKYTNRTTGNLYYLFAMSYLSVITSGLSTYSCLLSKLV